MSGFFGEALQRAGTFSSVVKSAMALACHDVAGTVTRVSGRPGSGRVADDHPAGAVPPTAADYATPGTEVTVVWGEHPGPGTDTDADLGFPRIRATVAPAPYDAHARTEYRRH
jgi:hypothetical protein